MLSRRLYRGSAVLFYPPRKVLSAIACTVFQRRLSLIREPNREFFFTLTNGLQFETFRFSFFF